MNRDEFIKEVKEMLGDRLKEMDGAEREFIGMRFLIGMNTDNLMPTIRVEGGIDDEGLEIFCDMVGLDFVETGAKIETALHDALAEITKALTLGINGRSKAVPIKDDELNKEIAKEINEWEQRMRTKH